MKFGTPLSEQAKAELKEAKGQIDEAIKSLKAGLEHEVHNIQTMTVLQTAYAQMQQAVSSLEYVRSDAMGNDYYKREAELGVHRVREAITNLKDVLRMLEVPE